MGVRDDIRKNSRLARLRLGQDAPEMVTIPSMPMIRCAQVPLTEAEVQRGVIAAAALEVEDNAAGLQARNNACINSDVYHSLREPGEIGKYVFDSVHDMTNELDGTDVSYLHDNLAILSSYSSPDMEGITQEELNELKKAFGETDWSALTGRQWAALKLACQHLFPNILQVRSSGDSSTPSVTPTNESGESTSPVSPS